MLPKLVAGSGYAGRDEADISAPSTRDRDILTADLTFSWNILDFGLSYVRAKQYADKYNIQVEMKRKIVNRIVEDVRTAYWRAVSYERLVNRMHALEGRVRGAARHTRAVGLGRGVAFDISDLRTRADHGPARDRDARRRACWPRTSSRP